MAGIRRTHSTSPPGAPTRAAVAATLRERILTGALRPGALLSPAELASEFDGSATPAREALIELTLEGLVESRPARGFMVRELTVREVQDLYPLVWTLEGLALRSAPPSAALLSALVRANEQIRHARQVRRVWELDAQWHALLVRECPNQELHAMLGGLKRRVYRYEDAYFRHSGALQVSVDQHVAIIAALGRKAVDQAIRLLEENWRTGPAFLVPWLERIGTPTAAALPQAGSRR